MEFTQKEIEIIMQVFSTIEKSMKWDETKGRYQSGLMRFKADNDEEMLDLFNINNKLKKQHHESTKKG